MNVSKKVILKVQEATCATFNDVVFVGPSIEHRVDGMLLEDYPVDRRQWPTWLSDQAARIPATVSMRAWKVAFKDPSDPFEVTQHRTGVAVVLEHGGWTLVSGGESPRQASRGEFDLCVKYTRLLDELESAGLSRRMPELSYLRLDPDGQASLRFEAGPLNYDHPWLGVSIADTSAAARALKFARSCLARLKATGLKRWPNIYFRMVGGKCQAEVGPLPLFQAASDQPAAFQYPGFASALRLTQIGIPEAHKEPWRTRFDRRFAPPSTAESANRSVYQDADEFAAAIDRWRPLLAGEIKLPDPSFRGYDGRFTWVATATSSGWIVSLFQHEFLADRETVVFNYRAPCLTTACRAAARGANDQFPKRPDLFAQCAHCGTDGLRLDEGCCVNCGYYAS